MPKIYVIARMTPDGEIANFPMAGGRGASVDSVRAFTSLIAARRSLRYMQTYGNNSYTILETETFSQVVEQ